MSLFGGGDLMGGAEDTLNQGAADAQNALKKGWKGYAKKTKEKEMPWYLKGADMASQNTTDFRDMDLYRKAKGIAMGDLDFRQEPGVQEQMQYSADNAAKSMNAQGHSWGPKADADIQANVMNQAYGTIRPGVLNPLIQMSQMSQQAAEAQATRDYGLGGQMGGAWRNFAENRYQHGANQSGVFMTNASNVAGMQAQAAQQAAANQNALMSGLIGLGGNVMMAGMPGGSSVAGGIAGSFLK